MLRLPPFSPSRCLLLTPLMALVASSGCKRDAERPLERAELFPDAGHSAAPPTVAAPLQRLTGVVAVEDDDVVERSLRIAPQTLISGTLGDGALGARDVEWLRIEPLPPDGELLRVDLRAGPPCLQVELYERAEGAPVRVAAGSSDEPPALPSLRLRGVGVWLRLRCPGKGLAAGQDGAWRLAVTARPATLDEEREPNDVASRDTRLVALGATLQGTIAPPGDVDVFRLDLHNALPGDAQMLSVAGVPDLALVLELFADSRPEPLLRRVGATGAALMVPNLDVRRLGAQPLLRLSALRGGRSAHGYAVTVRPLLPAGCRTQGSCPAQIPIEREPNDSRADAFGIRAGSQISALLDGRDDVDFFAIDGEPGDVLSVSVLPSEGMRAAVTVAEGGEVWAEVVATAPGEAIALPGRAVRVRRVTIAVRAEGHAGKALPYAVVGTLERIDHFEAEGEAPTPLPAREGGWSVTGALMPAGDVDEFWLDVGASARRLHLRVAGDGEAALRVQLLDGDGAEAAALVVDGEAEATRTLEAGPGRLRLRLDRIAKGLSRRPWRVAVDDLGPVDPPAALTPSDAPAAPASERERMDVR